MSDEPPKDDVTNEVSLEDDATNEVSLEDDDGGDGDLASQMFGGEGAQDDKEDEGDEVTATGGDDVAADAEAPTAAPAAAKAEPPKPYTFSIKISDPERIGDGMTSYVVYKIMAKTNKDTFSSPEMSVNRRFTDFFNLQRMLSFNHPGVIVPPCPPKDAVANTFVKFKSAGTELTPFVETRQYGLQRFLRRLVAHPALVDDPLFHQFLETDDKMPAPKKDYAALLAPMKFPAIEIDEWFDDKSRELTILERQLKKLHTAIAALCDGRRELSLSTTKFAESFAALAEAEELKQLTAAMHRLADVEAKVAKLHSKQATRDYYDFSEIVADYAQLVASAKVALAQRSEKLKALQNSEENLTKKKEAHERLKAAKEPKPDKIEAADKEAQDADVRMKEARDRYMDIARLCKKELERFDIIKIRDFQQMCVTYIEEVMNMEQLIMKEWESFLPEAKAIVV